MLLFLLRFIMVAAQKNHLSCALKCSPAFAAKQAFGKWEMQKL